MALPITRFIVLITYLMAYHVNIAIVRGGHGVGEIGAMIAMLPSPCKIKGVGKSMTNKSIRVIWR